MKKREGALKKARKAVDDKNPDLVKVETEIEHSERKAKSHAALVERVQTDQKRQADSVATLKAGGAAIRQKMEEARGESRVGVLSNRQRSSAKRARLLDAL